MRELFKEKLVKRINLFGAWTSISHPQITEMLIRSNVDFLGIDIEHSTISQEQSQRIIAACHANDILCLPRIATHCKESIKRLLDSGADGLIVPNVETPDQIEKLIEWSKYPPLGKRGYGIARAQGYGHDFEEYSSKWNMNSILIIQVESIQAVENINELLKFKEIDGVMIGPYDISGSLDIPGKINHPKVQAAGKRVVDVCKSHGKACGTQDIDPSQKSIEQAFKDGYSFVILASDVFILWKWGEKIRDMIKTFR
ncbi:MAG: 4-hydroxy-2-oxovalerate aldolase [Candidatus Marinimicrobia bacterium]|nr:4-hydroxy-2-oxovalerate aldolase [Candidatus Neomarinimicrobiota bacterium]|tara:strand:+ start:168 stop:935 length:768 start_codon:yes stop_codon:yes gene_type:complete